MLPGLCGISRSIVRDVLRDDNSLLDDPQKLRIALDAKIREWFPEALSERSVAFEGAEDKRGDETPLKEADDLETAEEDDDLEAAFAALVFDSYTDGQ